MTPEQAQAIYFAGRDAVVAHLCEMDEQMRASQQQIEALQRKIAQLSKNSSNSSKRPSSDDITKPKGGKHTRGADAKNGKIGGQPGHERHTRPPYPPESIDQTHQYELTCCPCCHTPDILLLADQPPRVIQQAEIKEVVVHEEHLAHAYWCESCGQIHYAEFPPAVLREGLFKSRLTALVAYMKHVCHASFSTIRKFLRDVLGEPVSRGLSGEDHPEGQPVPGAAL